MDSQSFLDASINDCPPLSPSLFPELDGSFGLKPEAMQIDDKELLKFTRVKDVGSRLTDTQKRNERIISIAQPLPTDNTLNGRGIYWFVTTRKVNVLIHDHKMFQLKDTQAVNGHFLYQIDFQQNKADSFTFEFPDNHNFNIEIHSRKTATKSNEKRKHDEIRQSDSESESVHLDVTTNNVNISSFEPINQQLEQTQKPPFIPPDISTNVLLLVPDEHLLLSRTYTAFDQLRYKQEASSKIFRLYSLKLLVQNAMRYILVLPYKTINPDIVMDCLSIANDAILLVENREDAAAPLMTVTRINNVNRVQNNEIVSATWQCIVKVASFPTIVLNYSSLDPLEQVLLARDELEHILSVVSYRHDLAYFDGQFSRYVTEWGFKPPASSEPKRTIYLCFKYEPTQIRPFSEYAAQALRELGLEDNAADAFSVNGSVLVYVRCRSYVLWYITLHKDKIFNSQAPNGLSEIYECFISDVQTSLDREDNEEFSDELNYLKEQMISDAVSEQPTPKRFRCTLSSASSTLAVSTIPGTQEPVSAYNRQLQSKSMHRSFTGPISQEDYSDSESLEDDEVYSVYSPFTPPKIDLPPGMELSKKVTIVNIVILGSSNNGVDQSYFQKNIQLASLYAGIFTHGMEKLSDKNDLLLDLPKSPTITQEVYRAGVNLELFIKMVDVSPLEVKQVLRNVFSTKPLYTFVVYGGDGAPGSGNMVLKNKEELSLSEFDELYQQLCIEQDAQLQGRLLMNSCYSHIWDDAWEKPIPGTDIRKKRFQIFGVTSPSSPLAPIEGNLKTQIIAALRHLKGWEEENIAKDIQETLNKMHAILQL